MSESIVGPWAADKLKRLGKYLHAYTTILRNKDWCRGYHYIDAFAGPGEHALRTEATSESDDPRQLLFDSTAFARQDAEHRQWIEGSPRVALNLKYPFKTYVFIERLPGRVAALEKLKAEYGDSRCIVIRQADCNDYLRQNVVNNPKLDWRSHRAFVFLDPFGMQVPWDTIAALGKTRAIDVFINFPVGMAIQRLLPRNPDAFTSANRTKLDEYFGSPEWFDVLYKRHKNLFGDEQIEKVGDSGNALLEWYQARLKQAFGHVSSAALIYNTRGGHLYYLIAASPKATGIRIANHILSAGQNA